MRRVGPAQLVPPEFERRSVRERARRPVGIVVDRDHRRDLSADRLGARRGSEEVVERAALVRRAFAARCGTAVARRRRSDIG